MVGGDHAVASFAKRLRYQDRTGIGMSDVEIAEQLLGSIATLSFSVFQFLHGFDGSRVWCLASMVCLRQLGLLPGLARTCRRVNHGRTLVLRMGQSFAQGPDQIFSERTH